MSFSFEITAAIVAILGFVAWLTKISVLQDMGLDKLRGIESKIAVIEATFVKESEFAKEIGRVEGQTIAAHKRIDDLKKER